MQCSCGGSTKSKKSKSTDFCFYYEQCKACGRIGMERVIMKKSGLPLLEGREARDFVQRVKAPFLEAI